MTDYTTTRPAPPAWLNLDAIAPPDVVERILAARDELNDHAMASVRLAHRLVDDLRTYSDRIDEADNAPDNFHLLVDQITGVDEIGDLVTVLAGIWERLNRGAPDPLYLAAAARRLGLESLDFDHLDLTRPAAADEDRWMAELDRTIAGNDVPPVDPDAWGAG